MNALEMKVVQLALSASIDRIIGEAFLYTSDNATVVAYLKK